MQIRSFMTHDIEISNDPGNQWPHLFNNIAGSSWWRRGADGGNK